MKIKGMKNGKLYEYVRTLACPLGHAACKNLHKVHANESEVPEGEGNKNTIKCYGVLTTLEKYTSYPEL